MRDKEGLQDYRWVPASSPIRRHVFSVLSDTDAVMISDGALGGGWWSLSGSFTGKNKYFVVRGGRVRNMASLLSRAPLAWTKVSRLRPELIAAADKLPNLRTLRSGSCQSPTCPL